MSSALHLQKLISKPLQQRSANWLRAGQHATLQSRNYSMPHWQNTEVTADGEHGITKVKAQPSHTITIRDPTSQSKKEGATPLSHFLAAIISGSQGSLTICAKEMGMQVGHVRWHASSKYDIRGAHGEEGATSQLKAITLVAELDTNAKAQQLEDLRQMVQKRSIIANTISKVKGLDFVVEYKSAYNFQSSMGTHI